MIASEDLAQWVGTQGNQGMITTPEMMIKDLSRAKELRRSFTEYLEDIGDGLALQLADWREGVQKASRPFEIGHLARMLGGTIAFQVNDQQAFCGSGELLVHI